MFTHVILVHDSNIFKKKIDMNVNALYFESTGDLKEEEEVLQWLITQRTEDRIELVTRSMLETIVQETQYLAVYFCKLS